MKLNVILSFFTLLLCSSLLIIITNLAHAQTPADYSNSGWIMKIAEIVKNDTSCGPNMTRYDVALKNYTDTTDITNFTDIQVNISIHPNGWTYDQTSDVLRETGLQNINNNPSPSICYNPLTEKAWPSVSAGKNSLFKSFTGAPWRNDSVTANKAQVGKHIRGYIHLLEKTGDANTGSLTYPVNQILNSTPTYKINFPAAPSLYNATKYTQVNTGIYNLNTKTLVGSDRWITLNGGAGNYTLPVVSLMDGYYLWGMGSQSNGSRGILGNNEILSTGRVDNRAPFLIDRTGPVSNTVMNLVTQTNAPNNALIVTTTQDTLSGLGKIIFSVEEINNLFSKKVISSTTYQYNFTVGSGIIGGPTNVQSISIPTTLVLGKIYQYYTTTYDAAGNIIKSSKKITDLSSVTPIIINDFCNDGIDNDGDGKIDYPADPGCTSPTDTDEIDPSIAILPPTITANGQSNSILIRSGSPVSIQWNNGEDTNCTLTPPLASGPITTGSKVFNPSSKITYQISCDAEVSSVVVNVVPKFQEI